jgi:hypothetical protein
MTSDSTDRPVTFSSSTRAIFPQYVHENPNNRRVSQAEKENLIQGLTNTDSRPSSQKDFSRRNYVRKTFAWDEKAQMLFAVAKKDEDKDREVVTADMIVDIVEFVHESNGHAGWDATWKAISSSYYGILRADVVFLLKRCQICAENPRKRPKGLSNAIPNFQLVDHTAHNFLNIDELFFDNSTSDELVTENRVDE